MLFLIKTPMTTAETEREVQCVANKVRPPPVKEDFEWSIGRISK